MNVTTFLSIIWNIFAVYGILCLILFGPFAFVRKLRKFINDFKNKSKDISSDDD